MPFTNRNKTNFQIILADFPFVSCVFYCGGKNENKSFYKNVYFLSTSREDPEPRALSTSEAHNINHPDFR